MRKYIGYVVCLVLICCYAVPFAYATETDKGKQYGFQKQSERYQQDIDSNIVVYEHEKSGATVVYIQNNDSNQAFAIGFKTPVYDSTGVNHIIEHTVFTGSKNYNTKDVFFEMNKRSPNIYMNASTAVDMTVYPFSTRNTKDYQYLLNVYLDAVFFPNLHEHRHGFDQEGWHYNIDEEGNISISGVVYNEMKGASVVPQRILAMENRAVMYPDTMYIHSAGGNPAYIPTLSYEDCKKSHELYYTPSNSCAFVYGDVDISYVLMKLNEYYSLFDKSKEQNISQKQQPFEQVQYHTNYYPATNQSEQCFVSYNYVVGEIQDIELQLSMEIVMNLLVQYEQSPLKRAVKQKELSKMIYAEVDSNLSQPMYSIIATDVNKKDIQKISTLIQKTLEQVGRDGFDQRLIEMAINQYEVRQKQKRSSACKGIDMAYDVIYSWGHDVTVDDVLQKDSVFQKIKQQGDSAYFQQLVRQYMLNNHHAAQVVLEPDTQYIEKQQQEEKYRLKKAGFEMTEEHKNNIIKNNEQLEQWQNSIEITSILPQLELQDIDRSYLLPQLQVKEGKKGKKLYYIADTNDLIYVNLYFDTSYIPQGSLNELFLFTYLMSEREKDAIALYTGGMNCQAVAIPVFDNEAEYEPKLKISACMKEKNMNKAFQIIEKAMYGINVWDSEWLLTQIHKIRSQYENYFASQPIQMMNIAVGNSQSGASRYEYEQAIPFYQYICTVEENYDRYKDQIMSKLSYIQSSVFSKQNVVLGATVEEKNIKKLESSYQKYYKRLYNVQYPKETYMFDMKYKRQGFPIASDVQYTVWAGNYKKAGNLYQGAWHVLTNILNTDYMLYNLRVKNGAYGAGVKLDPYGNIHMYTYQDPQLQKSLETIRDIPRYIAHFDIPDYIMQNYTIGALSKFEQSLGMNDHPKTTGDILQTYYLSGMPLETMNQVRNEIFDTTPSDIRDLSLTLKKVIEEKRYSTAGSKEKLINNSQYFDIIKSYHCIYKN